MSFHLVNLFYVGIFSLAANVSWFGGCADSSAGIVELDDCKV
ncbi:MAG: hypothetical protein VB074_02625 [Proteiniphilum sp.]|jgi:hypothetical protein|nr:hypothetical protein [Proteiniphilum sp.]MEA5127056.1 hypothetical protein [Proteiniphilum sp.]